MHFNPRKITIDYYFGDLQYWKLAGIAIQALDLGYDGPALRRLAGLTDVAENEIPACEIDQAFCELGVDAPVSKERARFALALDSAQRVHDGHANVFDEATYVRIHLCALSDVPPELKEIVELAREAKNAPRSRWDHIETELKTAFADCLRYLSAHRLP